LCPITKVTCSFITEGIQLQPTRILRWFFTTYAAVSSIQLANTLCSIIKFAFSVITAGIQIGATWIWVRVAYFLTGAIPLDVLAFASLATRQGAFFCCTFRVFICSTRVRWYKMCDAGAFLVHQFTITRSVTFQRAFIWFTGLIYSSTWVFQWCLTTDTFIPIHLANALCSIIKVAFIWLTGLIYSSTWVFHWCFATHTFIPIQLANALFTTLKVTFAWLTAFIQCFATRVFIWVHNLFFVTDALFVIQFTNPFLSAACFAIFSLTLGI